jgi:chromosome segregation ATPase
MNDEKLTRRERELRHQLEVADERLKQAHRVQGRQGQKIAELRGELARTREEHSKLDRGELRKLENFAEQALKQFEEDRKVLRRSTEEKKQLRDENKRLREKLSDQEPSGLAAQVQASSE